MFGSSDVFVFLSNEKDADSMKDPLRQARRFSHRRSIKPVVTRFPYCFEHSIWSARKYVRPISAGRDFGSLVCEADNRFILLFVAILELYLEIEANRVQHGALRCVYER